jgi:hypothetical protein
MTPVESGSIVVVRGKLGEQPAPDQIKAVVRWCIGKTDGTFRAGLEFLGFRSTLPLNGEQPSSIHSDTLDCYEVMQLSPNADLDTISRVYRLLAFRYHPDNVETGNSEMFIRLSKAHQILSDPQKRAAYDMRRREAQHNRWKSFNQTSASTGSETAKRKPEDVKREVSVSRRGEPEGSHFRASAGALCGWDAALRAL